MPLSEPIVVSDLKTLREVVLAAISECGPSVDLNFIDVKSVDSFTALFKDTGFCGDVSQWNMANAKSTKEMFAGTPFNSDISRWNVARLEDARSMFKDSHFNGDISRWNVKLMLLCEKYKGMFDTLHFSQDLTPWNIANGYDDFRTQLLLSLTQNPHLLLAITGEEQPKSETPTQSELLEKGVKRYATIFGGKARLGEYFTRATFGVMHFDACCASTGCPVGIDQDDFEWSREMFSVGVGLGLDNAGLRVFCADQIGIRNMRTTESFSLDGMLSA